MDCWAGDRARAAVLLIPSEPGRLTGLQAVLTGPPAARSTATAGRGSVRTEAPLKSQIRSEVDISQHVADS